MINGHPWIRVWPDLLLVGDYAVSEVAKNSLDFRRVSEVRIRDEAVLTLLQRWQEVADLITWGVRSIRAKPRASLLSLVGEILQSLVGPS
jgi:hypothetical protein